MNVSKRIIEDLVNITNRLYALDSYLAECEYNGTIEEIRELCIQPALDAVSLRHWVEQLNKLHQLRRSSSAMSEGRRETVTSLAHHYLDKSPDCVDRRCPH